MCMLMYINVYVYIGMYTYTSFFFYETLESKLQTLCHFTSKYFSLHHLRIMTFHMPKFSFHVEVAN